MTTVTQERIPRTQRDRGVTAFLLEPEPEPYVVTSAEMAECCCPDACERDHDNE